MLTIGEFSNICRVSTKTLRYYAEIGLVQPNEINPENGYRYYSIDQLEKMLLINRLKNYCFSLEEIKSIFESEELIDEVLFTALNKKKKEIVVQVQKFQDTLHQIDGDLSNLRKGKSIMSYMESIDIQLVEIPRMYLLSMRKNVLEHEFSEEYGTCFGKLFRKMEEKKLTAATPPMVLFHGDEYTPFGLDTEFAIPIKEYAIGTRDFCPGLCLKTVVQGSYLQLSSVYAKQIEWAEREGYENSNALYEVYVTDPTEVSKESELVTEVYYLIKKRVFKDQNGKQIL
ncbi:MAG: MerR family transcriptional regulator [Lachnospiraceae bacterium]